VTIAPSAGITDKGVGYGVLLNGVAPRKSGRIDIDEITTEIVKDMQRDNGLEPVRSAQPITVGGAEGRSAVFQSRSPFPSANGQPQLEHDWLVTVPARDGGVIFMIFVAPESDFARFQSTYDTMLKSVQLN
jgi:hypothetical protein